MMPPHPALSAPGVADATNYDIAQLLTVASATALSAEGRRMDGVVTT
jgi:hypothetical protein